VRGPTPGRRPEASRGPKCPSDRALRPQGSAGGEVALELTPGLSCSPGETAPASYESVPLLVTNGTCLEGHCDSLRVIGFPVNQPNTPGGPWSLGLGVVTTPQACLTIPPSGVFRVIGVHDDGARDTVAYTWTPALGISLGAQPPSSLRRLASPSTASFVPAGAAGWSVTLPGDSVVQSAASCAPDGAGAGRHSLLGARGRALQVLIVARRMRASHVGSAHAPGTAQVPACTLQFPRESASLR
jgi:hypothetical protein